MGYLYAMNKATQESKLSSDTDEGVSHRLTFLLHRIVSVLVDASSPQFRSLGLSIPAARALVALYEGGSQMTVGKLAETTSTDLSTMSHILRRLESQQLISRTRLEGDNRVVYATLTDQGRSVGKECHDASLEHEAVLLSDMSPDESALLKRTLIRLYRNAKAGFEP
ncbi:marR family protein [Paraburkholderia xenovorans LB400]|uniref:Transcriptional regulator, MarR family n=1 Tax=Paraburkholderia xenovorans (strain LB400) TaxID=266265 RepID=Q13ZY0_PARXL|nr:transcriptional regulator, MarR family [Paraburkholderia xenovorans LB400]ABE30359.1 transcriptional regulator, MarR family [Paraburkholderia xenovorans LB400]AIP32388.1 marR family protein [Paraburkholderia xenovorans LB400]